jgi:hypothetical protein
LHLINATPEVINYEELEGDYVQFDQSALVKEYKSKLVYSHARFTALQKDYEKLQAKCSALRLLVDSYSPKNKNTNMENQHFDPVSIPEHAGQQPGHSDDPAILKDLLEEKIAQISFLQQQLDQRIRSYHQADRELKEVRARFEKLSREAEAVNSRISDLTDSITAKEALAEDLRRMLAEKENELAGKSDLVTWLENSLRDSREQNEMLSALSADNSDRVSSLEAAMEKEKAMSGLLQQKLENKRQVMRRLFAELASDMEPDQPASPVIEMKTAFVTDHQKELVETIG